MDVIVFNKTKDDRLKEFQDILTSDTRKMLATSVAAHWSFHLELTLEPVGWQALWKLPRHKCDWYQLKFPTVVLVEVMNVDFKELTAMVTVLKVQDAVDIPMDHEVELKNLYPTQHQENAVDAVGTANSLDQLRFFYNHLWRPWDCDDGENEDWPCNYLEPRLQLYYDMQQRVLCRETAERISKLIIEGRGIYSKIKKLESQFDVEAMDEELPTDSADAAYTLLQLHVRLEPIKTELRILENPVMRVLLEKKVAMAEKREPEKYIVWNGQNLGKYMDLLKAVEKLSGPETVVKPISSLQVGLDMAQAGDTFILSSGTHDIIGSSRLEEGGVIFGIEKGLSAGLRRQHAGNFFLDVGSGTLSVQNVLVDSDNVDIAFLVRPKGSLELKNVRLNATKCSAGVVVLPGGSVHLEQCELKGFQSGVYCHPGGSVVISNSEISGCSVGLQVKAFGGTKVKIENSVISDCRNVAIDVVDKNLSATGPIEILKEYVLPHKERSHFSKYCLVGFSCSNVETKSNKADIVVQQHSSVLEGDEPGSCF